MKTKVKGRRGGYRPGAGRKKKIRVELPPLPGPRRGLPLDDDFVIQDPVRYGPTEKDRRMVAAMVAYGIPESDIALVLEINIPTLQRHFATEIATGRPIAHSKVAEFIYNGIVNGTAYRRDPRDPENFTVVTIKDDARVRLAIKFAEAQMGWGDPAQAADKERRPHAQIDSDARQRTFALVEQAARRITGRVAGETDPGTESNGSGGTLH